MRHTALLLACLLACSDDPAAEKGDGSEGGEDTNPTPTDDTGPGPDTGPAPYDPVEDCTALGLGVVPFEASAADDPTLYALAADFEVPTLDGTWRLSEQWSGCDNYLFIPETPRQEAGAPRGIWERAGDFDDLLERTPPNTHIFFLPKSADAEGRAETLADLVEKVEGAYEDMDEETVAWWRRHVHFVDLRGKDIEGWLGDTITNPGWGAGIDRSQRVRYIGSFADPRRYDADYGWFGPNLMMAANEAIYYNYQHDRDARLAAEDALVVPTFTGELVSDGGWSGAPGTVSFELPDAATMAGYDTLELDMELLCEGAGEYGECPAWDYLTYLWVCPEGDCSACNGGNHKACPELGRYITTYHREGRWVHDVSALLPLFAAGGPQKLAFWTVQPYNVSLDLRFTHQGKEGRAEDAQLIFVGGTFNSTYSDREPVLVDIPADVVKVEVAAVLSGHGMNDPDNCAEFCVTDHHVYVNGADYLWDLSMPEDDSQFGCMEQIEQGTVPNQYGTWWYGRNGWCPGKPVDMLTQDITADIVPGAVNELRYAGYHEGLPYTGSATMDAAIWLVVYR